MSWFLIIICAVGAIYFGVLAGFKPIIIGAIIGGIIGVVLEIIKRKK